MPGNDDEAGRAVAATGLWGAFGACSRLPAPYTGRLAGKHRQEGGGNRRANAGERETWTHFPVPGLSSARVGPSVTPPEARRRSIRFGHPGHRLWLHSPSMQEVGRKTNRQETLCPSSGLGVVDQQVRAARRTAGCTVRTAGPRPSAEADAFEDAPGGRPAHDRGRIPGTCRTGPGRRGRTDCCVRTPALSAAMAAPPVGARPAPAHSGPAAVAFATVLRRTGRDAAVPDARPGMVV